MQAVQDADLHFPQVAETFSCAVGVRITETDTPRLYVLLRRSLGGHGALDLSDKDDVSASPTIHGRWRAHLYSG
jgi:acid phosphatase (class A)